MLTTLRGPPMTSRVPEAPPLPEVDDFIEPAHPLTGTDDDLDDRDDEHADENEASIREVNENTETPEEFEIDDEDEPG
jgi:hypothetical protein